MCARPAHRARRSLQSATVVDNIRWGFRARLLCCDVAVSISGFFQNLLVEVCGRDNFVSIGFHLFPFLVAPRRLFDWTFILLSWCNMKGFCYLRLQPEAPHAPLFTWELWQAEHFARWPLPDPWHHERHRFPHSLPSPRRPVHAHAFGSRGSGWILMVCFPMSSGAGGRRTRRDRTRGRSPQDAGESAGSQRLALASVSMGST